jgi:hypothetical protein
MIFRHYIIWLKPQPPPPQSFEPHAPICRAGQADSAAAWVWAAGTLNFFSSFVLPQLGQRGFSLPRINNSNSSLQSLHVYS